jgi:hypothetical protein
VQTEISHQVLILVRQFYVVLLHYVHCLYALR